jgi:hypothetical protein
MLTGTSTAQRIALQLRAACVKHPGATVLLRRSAGCLLAHKRNCSLMVAHASCKSGLDSKANLVPIFRRVLAKDACFEYVPIHRCLKLCDP